MSENGNPGPCPELPVLLRASDGTLEDADWRKFIRHLLRCPRCRDEMWLLIPEDDEEDQAARPLPMECLGTTRLVAYYDRSLTGSDREAAARHLQKCSFCRGEIESLAEAERRRHAGLQA